MKWYFAINEAGTSSVIGTHAKCAVLSARRNTRLRPHLLYTGARNAFTAWMERHGVVVRDVELSFADTIRRIARTDEAALRFTGHWLRSNICLIEREDPFVLYTDCDVVFRSDPAMAAFRPALFACAPEFREENWDYCNSGVMLMNVAALRTTYAEFEAFIVGRLTGTRVPDFLDQDAYNQFYKGRWDRLDPLFNWKPYWGCNQRAPIVHFHGPKISDIRAIAAGEWNWDDAHPRILGSLFSLGIAGYVQALSLVLDGTAGAELPERDGIVQVLRGLLSGPIRIRPDRIDLGFMQIPPVG